MDIHGHFRQKDQEDQAADPVEMQTVAGQESQGRPDIFQFTEKKRAAVKANGIEIRLAPEEKYKGRKVEADRPAAGKEPQ